MKVIDRKAVIREVQELSHQTAVCYANTSDPKLEKLAEIVIQKGELLELAESCSNPETWENVKMAYYAAYFDLYYYVKRKK